MKCKKCGRPMGNKGYCSVCGYQKSHKDEPKKTSKNLWWIILVCVLCAAAIVWAIVSLTDDDPTDTKTTFTNKDNNQSISTDPTQPASDGDVNISGKHHVEIEIQNYGTIKLELDADVAPITVANFLDLAGSGFYDGLTLHRIMEGFMMQGGDPEGTGMGGSDKNIKGEFSANGVDNPLSHTRGAISMARNGYSMDSASSQFFIVHQDSTFLDGQYACFGYVTEGMDVVDAICAYSSTVVIDDNGTIPAADQPIITAIKVID